MDYEALLREFLSTPLDNGDLLFERFAALPGAVSGKGDKLPERFVYIPGTRKDRVLLVAHADTVWDAAYDKVHYGAPTLGYENGIFFSTDETCGIGADDRAGCAMLWMLRDCGHSILLVDGEEHGKFGANYLKTAFPALFREVNRHCFLLELDWRNTGNCLYTQVPVTKRFKKYLSDELGIRESPKGGGTDLGVLCRTVCGANLGVGYLHYHTPKEQLSVEQWTHTLHALQSFLQKPQKRFGLSRKYRLKVFYFRCRRVIGAPIKKLLKRA